ncbi:MAG TPA: PPC domain-containing protein, partial [Urbifossiella sp.]
PLLPLPDSQQQEDYPADMTGSVAIAKDAPLGPRRGWVFSSQGGAGGLVFVVGDLPEVLEKETDGDPIPNPVKLPITANGRIFPRDNIDLWEFEANAGQTVSALALAKSLHSPLAPKLEILDANGRVLAENMVYSMPGSDESVLFTAPAKGKYRVRIGDSQGQGGQAYVYRITLTSGNVPLFAFPLKVPPDGVTDAQDMAKSVQAPIALNGRIAKAGGLNEWKVELKKANRYSLDLQARRFDSPLRGVITVLDTAGKELARGEAADSASDPTLAFQPPTDGVYRVRIEERFRSRGGPNFIYRLRIAESTIGAPGFRLTIPPTPRQPQESTPDAITVPRGTTIKVRVNIERTGGFTGPIELTAVVGPAVPAEQHGRHSRPYKCITCKPVLVPANQNTGELTITADKDAPITSIPFTIIGSASVGNGHVAVTGARAAEARTLHVPAVLAGDRFLPDSASLYLTVAMPTPFKIIDEYVMTSAPRGEIYRRKYRIERDPGFTGPIEVRLADRQARHLQGVTGPVLIVPPGQTEVEYPASLPPWMELGRTCRVCVMAVGKVKDADGTEHSVSFSSVNQNQQMIVVVGPGRLDVSLEKLTIRAVPGSEVRVPVKVIRARELSGPVTVDAAIPEHWKGVSAAAITIPSDKQTGEIVVKFAAGECGPFNMPLVVRATLKTPATPIIAEAKLEVVK